MKGGEGLELLSAATQQLITVSTTHNLQYYN